jgi:D-alanyl-D-alanine carboxypeptidase
MINKILKLISIFGIISLGFIFMWGIKNSIPEIFAILNSYKQQKSIEQNVGSRDIEENENTDESYEETEDIVSSGYYSKVSSSISTLSLTAKSVLVADLETGEKLFIKKPDLQRPIASVSKLLTSLVVKINFKEDEIIYVSDRAVNTYGTQAELKAGSQFTTKQLLYALLIESSNDAAEAFAEHFGREKFIEEMNNQIKLLHISNTSMEDPSGLSEKNISTCSDLFILSQYIYNIYPSIFDVTTTSRYKAGRYTWFNNNKMIQNQFYIGGKNGYTDEAMDTLVNLFDLPLGENGEKRKIFICLLGGYTPTKEAQTLINFLRRNITYISTELDSSNNSTTTISSSILK